MTAAQNAEAVARSREAFVEPEAGLHRRIAARKASPVGISVAHAPDHAPVHGRHAVYEAYSGTAGEPQPHGPVVGQPFGMLLRADLGIVGRDQLTAGQRRAVGDRNAEQHLLEIGIVPVGIGFQGPFRLPVFVCARITHAAAGIGLHQIGLHLQLAEVGPPVVSVAVGHVFPAAGVERAAVVGPPADVAGARHQPHAAGVFRSVFAAELRRAVRTAILAQHQFDAERGLLGEHALDGLTQVGRVVIGGHAD